MRNSDVSLGLTSCKTNAKYSAYRTACLTFVFLNFIFYYKTSLFCQVWVPEDFPQENSIYF